MRRIAQVNRGPDMALGQAQKIDAIAHGGRPQLPPPLWGLSPARGDVEEILMKSARIAPPAGEPMVPGYEIDPGSDSRALAERMPIMPR
jgi:hypothetical protein